MKSGFDRIGFSVTPEHAKRSCLDKRPYGSRNIARDAATKNEKRYGLVFRPYRCSICGYFHLTTRTPPGLANR